MSDAARRAELADYARRLHARGWVANHDGNLTARAGDGRYFATPTATSKAAVAPDSILIVDESGARISGRGKPFGELGLHLTVYRNRPDVNAVVHAHPPTATGFAVAGVALSEPMIAEAVVSLGVGVPTVPFAAPGPAACQALLPFVGAYDAVLLGGHGVLAWGADVEQAFLRLELVEHLAKIALVARQLGGVRAMPGAVIPALLEARAKAGLGAAASRSAGAGAGAGAGGASVGAGGASAGANSGGANSSSSANANLSTGAATSSAAASASASATKTVVACAPAPPGSDVQVYEKPRAAVLPAPADLAAIIRQEIVSALSSTKK